MKAPRITHFCMYIWYAHVSYKLPRYDTKYDVFIEVLVDIKLGVVYFDIVDKFKSI